MGKEIIEVLIPSMSKMMELYPMKFSTMFEQNFANFAGLPLEISCTNLKLSDQLFDNLGYE